MQKQVREILEEEAGGGAIDVAHLDRATFGDRALRDDVLTLFLRQSSALVMEIAEAGDGRARSRAAHKLKGAALGIGAMDVAEAAAAFEPAQDDEAALAIALARLAGRINAACAGIRQLLAVR